MVTVMLPKVPDAIILSTHTYIYILVSSAEYYRCKREIAVYILLEHNGVYFFYVDWLQNDSPLFLGVFHLSNIYGHIRMGTDL